MWSSVSQWCVFMLFFFFKQKTAYEMRISDWSSDVCSSDLLQPGGDVGRVIGSRFVRDPEIGEQERCGQLGGRFLHGERVLGPLGAEIPVEPMGCATGMSCLVNMGGVEAVGVVEGAEIRHVDAVFGDVIIGAGRAVDGL